MPPKCKGKLETERNMWYVSETRVMMTSLGSTLMEKNVMKQGVLWVLTGIISAHLIEQRKEYFYVFSCVLLQDAL